MTIGMALSGGGARGIAHAGVIKALEEMGVTLSHISGTSMGAIIGSLYAYGYTPDEILEIIKGSSLFRFIRISRRWSGLLSMDRLGKWLLRYMPQNNFDQLRIPLYIAATEIRKAETHYLTSGELIPAVLASCAVPALFNPVRHKKGLYVDGGLLDNLPSTAIKYRCDFTIGSHCNPVSKNFDINGANIRKIVERSMVVVLGSNIAPSRRICDVLIEPQELAQFSSFDMGKAKTIFEAGYTFTKNNYSKRDFVKKQHG